MVYAPIIEALRESKRKMTERYGETDRRAEVVRQILAAEPGVSDREIGRRLGVHHSFPNRVRHEMRQHDADTSIHDRTAAAFPAGEPVAAAIPGARTKFEMTLLDLQLLDGVMDRVERLEEHSRMRDAIVDDCIERLVGLRDALKKHVAAEEWDKAVKRT